jgi:hypothetical protein
LDKIGCRRRIMGKINRMVIPKDRLRILLVVTLDTAK